MAVPRDLMRAMLGFGAMLRASGLPVTTSALMDAVRALEMVDLLDRAQVYLALRTVLVSRMEEQPTGDLEGAQQKQAQIALEDWDEGEAQEGEPLEVPGQSDREVLMEHDFSTFPAEQLEEVARLTVQIAKRLARRVSRRRKPTRRGGVVDLRQIGRAACRERVQT